MKTIHNKSQNKGAAITAPSIPDNSSDLFTYIFADEKSENLRVFNNQNDEWMKQRDNGRTFNADASTLKKFLKPPK